MNHEYICQNSYDRNDYTYFGTIYKIKLGACWNSHYGGGLLLITLIPILLNERGRLDYNLVTNSNSLYGTNIPYFLLLVCVDFKEARHPSISGIGETNKISDTPKGRISHRNVTHK